MLETVKDQIINGINPSWTNIQKIRYVYLELGKVLTKDADFFISAQKKFDSKKLTFEDLNDIYNSDNGRITDDKIAVICRSSCYILKDILKDIGIQSKVLKTKYPKLSVNNSYKKLDVFHYILEVKDGSDYYLMSLSGDTPYIHNGMKTQHFATDIPFSYKKSDGTYYKLYEDGQDTHSLISEDDLRDIDEEVGYLNYYYNYDHHGNKLKDYQLQYDDNSLHILKMQQRNNNLYYNLELKNTDFYKELYTYKVGNVNLFLETEQINKLNKLIKDKWTRKLCIRVTEKIMALTHNKIDLSILKETNWSYDNWLKEMCIFYKKDIVGDVNNKELDINEYFDYNTWSKEVKKNIEFDFYDYSSVLAILDKTNALVNLVYKKTSGKFNNLFNKLGYHFIDKDYIYDKNNITSKYIEHKFYILFPYVFSANDVVLPFNKDSYAEQSALIKEIIEMLFSELNTGKKGLYSPVFNRIQLYTVQNTKTKDYDIVFNIPGDKSQGDQYFLYKIKENKFDVVNVIKMIRSKEYTIISERFQNKLVQIDEGKKR